MTLPAALGATVNVADLRRLHVHAAHHDDIGPLEIGVARTLHVLVDEADRPALRHVGRDQQQPLRRHEGAHLVHERERVRESAERRRVGGKHAKDVASTTDRNRASHRLLRNKRPYPDDQEHMVQTRLPAMTDSQFAPIPCGINVSPDNAEISAFTCSTANRMLSPAVAIWRFLTILRRNSPAGPSRARGLHF